MERVIKVTLVSNAPGFTGEMGGAGRALGDVGTAARRTGADLEGAGRQSGYFGGILNEAKSTMLGFVGAQAVIGGVTTVINTLKDSILGFDSQMTESLAIMGDVSASTRAQLEGTARAVAVDYNMAIQDVAQSYYFLVSAGYDVASSQAALPQVTAFAKAGMFDLELATSLAADAQSAMGLKSANAGENLKQLTRITDVLTQAGIDSNASVEQFSAALTNKAAVSARSLGIELEDVVAVLEVFADKGLKGLKAGEGFSIVLRDLQEKSRTNADAFEALGIEVFGVEGQFRGFPAIMEQVTKATAGMSVEQTAATLSTLGMTAEGMNFMKMLLGSTEQLKKYTASVRDSGGATQEVAERQMQSMAEKLAHIKAVAIDLGIGGFQWLVAKGQELGTMLAPAFEKMATLLRDVWGWVEPIGRGFAVLAGTALVATIIALANGLGAVSGFLHDHQEIVITLAALYGMHLTASIYRAVAAWVAARAAAAGAMWSKIAGDITYMAGAFTQVAGNVGKFRAAMQVLDFARPAMAMAGLTVLIMGVTQTLQESSKQAEEWVTSLSKGFNPSDFDSMVGAVNTLVAEQHKLEAAYNNTGPLSRFGSSLGDLLVPFHDVTDSAWDQKAKLEELEKKYPGLTEQVGKTADELLKLAMFLRGPDSPKATLGATTEQLKLLAKANNIDMSKPTAEWSDKLKDLYIAANTTRPELIKVADAMGVVADETSTAADKLKAYKEAMDALLGIHISAFDAETKFSGAVATMTKVLGENTAAGLLPSTEAGRANRDAFSGAAKAAMDHALAVADETKSVAAGNQVLGNHVFQLYGVLRQMGLNDDQAKEYLKTLGLTPENLATLVQLNGDESARQALGIMQGQVGDLRQGADVHVRVWTTREDILQMDKERAARGASAAMGLASGGIVGFARGGINAKAYANGGTENHIAQIAPAGTWRVWAEPETGGEAYIPLAASKRDRSELILAEVARRFGLGVVPAHQSYAAGGIAGGGYPVPTPMGSYGGGAVTVNVHPGAVRVEVRVAAHADRGAVRDAVEAAVRPALDEFQRELVTELQNR